jgi:pimeloyl-ACP methyl ester carboxylesterase
MVVVHDVWHTPIHLRGLRARLAEAGWRVFTPGLPGHGAGTSRGRWPDAAVDTVVAAIGRAAGGEPVTVVGHGWGAAVASAAAGRVPRLVRQVVHIGGVLPTDGPRSLWDETSPLLRLVLDQGRDPGRGVVAPPDVTTWWRWWARPHPPGAAGEAPSTLVRRIHTTLVPAPVSALTGRLDLEDFYALARAGAVRAVYLRPVGSDGYGARYRWAEFASCLGPTAEVRDLPGEHERLVLRPAGVARAVHAAASGLAPWDPPRPVRAA